MQIIGDGAITGGMAYEAMNHAGFLDKNMIVILNDNQQVTILDLNAHHRCSHVIFPFFHWPWDSFYFFLPGFIAHTV